MTTPINAPPPPPVPTGNAARDSAANNAHFAQLVAHFEKLTPVVQPTSPSAVRGPRAPAPPDPVVAFDAEMRTRGIQTGTGAGEIARLERAVEAVHAERRAMGKAPTTAQLAAYELKLSGALERLQHAQGVFSPPPQTPSVATSIEPPSGAEVAAARALVRAVDADGFAPGTAFTSELSSGYTLPAEMAFEPESTVSMLAAARAAGITQAQVDAYVAALS